MADFCHFKKYFLNNLVNIEYFNSIKSSIKAKKVAQNEWYNFKAAI